eukprot:10372763-Alexandrium_andersonii.AAC.1
MLLATRNLSCLKTEGDQAEGRQHVEGGKDTGTRQAQGRSGVPRAAVLVAAAPTLPLPAPVPDA